MLESEDRRRTFGVAKPPTGLRKRKDRLPMPVDITTDLANHGRGNISQFSNSSDTNILEATKINNIYSRRNRESI